MVVLSRIGFSLLALMLVVSCFNNDEFETHSNPTDRIFDDGNFRVVLTGPEPQLDGTFKLSWSDVYSTEVFSSIFKSFDNSKFTVSSGKLLTINRAITDSEITQIKNGQALSGYTTAATINKNGDSLEGNASINLSAGTNSIVIELVYSYDSLTSVTMHSNVLIYDN